MGKYEPLAAFLAARPATEAPMSFSEIEKVIGVALPPAAYRHAAWWSNNPSNNVMTKVWLDAGFRTERVDLGARRLVFRRVASTKTTARPPRFEPRPGAITAMRRALRGTMRIAPGVDPGAPTGEAWDALEQ